MEGTESTGAADSVAESNTGSNESVDVVEDRVPTRFEKLEAERDALEEEGTPEPVEAAEENQESVEETEEEGSEEQKSPEDLEAKADHERFEVVKINGKEENVSIAELKKRYQKEAAADQKMMEAAAMRKQSTALVSLLKERPIDAILHPSVGLSKDQFREIAENWLYEEIKRENLPEAERKNLELEEKLAKIESDKKAAADAEREAEETKAFETRKEAVIKEITSAVAEAGLPQSADIIKRTAHYMKLAKAEGYGDVSPKQVLPLVRRDLEGMVKSWITGLSPDKMIETLGSEVADKINESRISKLKNPEGTTPPNQPPKNEKKKGPKKNPRMTMAEWREYNEKIKAAE